MSKKIIVGDCETCPVDCELDGVIASNMFAYDFGWCVCDKSGNVIVTRSYINKDVFYGQETLMKSAYYADKIPMYEEELKSGKRQLASLYEIRKVFLNDIKKYDIEEFYAHNARFDVGALNNTQRYDTKSKYRYFIPRNVKVCDSLKMARSVVAKMPTYVKFCEENGFMTKNNQVRLTAEVLYRFITKNLDFVENHTGLEDVLIEKEIVAYCYRQHKKMKKYLYE